MCNADYQQSLIIISDDDGDDKRSPVPATQEINLFFHVIKSGIPAIARFELNIAECNYHSNTYASPPGDIFHPPLV